MNKKDIKLIVILLSISCLILFVINIIEDNNVIYANVYKDNKLVLKIDLSKNNIYEVMGTAGVIKLEVFDNKIKVIEEVSNLNICSKVGYIDKKGESIICMPNDVVIKIEDENLDTVIR